ncbi:hypothetical protein LPJ61_000851 [Coemansia biformis]|uniref:Neurochondrin-domain-containing protein n=1 Tax=Coemansia biformis TaxID=1286918 RepID=A0A9W8CYP1_9FUNG|nr:hypothetical protein LPJ61_000851 [Coemansia biformis]
MAGSEQLDRCARLLSRKATDDEKFAGLLLMPRIVDPHDHEALAYVFEALDCMFIERLMRTGLKQVAETPSGDGLALLAIAVSVVDVLASQGSIASDPRMLDRIPTLCEVASLNIAAVPAEAVQALSKLLAQDAAVQVLLGRPELLAGIVDAASARADSLGLSQFLDYALNRCSTCVSACGGSNMDGWVHAVACAAAAFASSDKRLKFEMLPVLANALEPIGAGEATAADECTSCASLVGHISAGCIGILKQKTEAAAYSDQALVLYSHLVRLWPEHVFLGVVAPRADGDVGAPVPRPEAELALRLACVEGQASVDAMMICEPDDSSAQSAREADRLRVQHGWKLPFCTAIVAGWLEWAALWLDDLPFSADVDEAGLCAMMGEVQGLASSAVGFLTDWRERVPSEQDMLASGPELVLGAVRLLGKWLATDPKLHQAAVPVLAMCAAWVTGSDEHGAAVAEYVRPCLAFALDTCGISEAQYIEELVARELRHGRSQARGLASPWVGTMEFDDLARAVYSIPSDEDVLRDRQARPHDGGGGGGGGR